MFTDVQEEAGKLRGGEKLHQELKDKFQAAGDELEATKDTLSKTLQLLAEKTSQASKAESQVADAEKRLEVSRAAHRTALPTFDTCRILTWNTWSLPFSGLLMSSF